MAGSDCVQPAAFYGALVAACESAVAARDELGELDAAAGDGDLGATLALGFQAVRDDLSASGELDVGRLLGRVGAQLAKKAPSTMGALLGSAFLRAGKELSGVSGLDAEQAARMLRAAAMAVAERGGATTGERTVLDAMVPAADSAEAASREGSDVAEVLRRAALAAKAGADATAEMEPKHGRAAWIGERARGRPDAGAMAWSVILTGLANGVEMAPGAECVSD